MAFDESRVGDPDELGVMAKLFDVMLSAITHARAQTAHELEDHVREASAEGNPALDAFGNELFRARLEISVLAARSHRAERTHAAIDLEAPALEHFDLAGSLFRAREQAAYHDRARAAAESLDYIAAVLYTAVGDDALAHLIRLLGAVHDRRRLRHAYAGNDARRADGTGTDTHFDHVRAVFKECLRAFRRGDVAHDEREPRELALDHGNAGEHVFALSVRGVDRDHVHARIHERAHSFDDVRRDADRSTREQPSRLILGGMGVFDGFFDVFDGDETFEIAVLVHKRQFFYPMHAQDLLRLFERRAHGRGYQIILGHDLADELGEIRFKAQIAVGDDTDELFAARDRNAAYLELAHEIERIAELMFGRQMEGVGDNAVFAAFDLVHLLRLGFYAHVLVYHAQTAFAREGYCKLIFRDRIHGSAQKRDIQHDVVRELGGNVHLSGHDVGIFRNEQDVVKS